MGFSHPIAPWLADILIDFGSVVIMNKSRYLNERIKLINLPSNICRVALHFSALLLLLDLFSSSLLDRTLRSAARRRDTRASRSSATLALVWHELQASKKRGNKSVRLNIPSPPPPLPTPIISTFFLFLSSAK
ncbi:hypothetical protein ACJBU6_05185 [Exserohilum turcicum]